MLEWQTQMFKRTFSVNNAQLMLKHLLLDQGLSRNQPETSLSLHSRPAAVLIVAMPCIHTWVLKTINICIQRDTLPLGIYSSSGPIMTISLALTLPFTRSLRKPNSRSGRTRRSNSSDEILPDSRADSLRLQRVSTDPPS